MGRAGETKLIPLSALSQLKSLQYLLEEQYGMKILKLSMFIMSTILRKEDITL